MVVRQVIAPRENLRHRPVASANAVRLTKTSRLLALVLCFCGAQAAETQKEVGLGLQIGLVFPASEDLRITTGPGPNPVFGIHAIWDINEFHGLRPRMDLWSFHHDHQERVAPQLQQIETRVQGLALGGEYLFRPGGHSSPWAAGAGFYLIRWSVESRNQLTFPGTTVQATGTSRWTRAGFGVLACYRLTSRLDAEARWISSRYGYENLSANIATVDLLWRF